MAGSSNFQDHNPGSVNQQSDATYATDTTRTGGIVTNQVLPGPWINKIWRQCSVMASALGDMLAAKGYTVSDASRTTLATQLANIVTWADLPIAVVSQPARALNTSYQNLTGRNLFVSTTVIGHAATFSFAIGSSSPGTNIVSVFTCDSGASANLQVCGIVPPNWFYEVSGSGSVSNWSETEFN
jgi:hypothetical protein